MENSPTPFRSAPPKPVPGGGKMVRLQGLRAIAFLGIFFCHALYGRFLGLGPLGVSIFLILSGFLMMLSYSRKDQVPRFGFRFAWGKVRRLYPLHLITMLAVLALELFWILYGGRSLGEYIPFLGKALLHSLLLQSWIPVPGIYSSLNSVSWFLCASFLCYLLFPLVFPRLRRLQKASQVLRLLLGLLLLQGVIALGAKLFCRPEPWAVPCAHWLTYYFPPARFVDFLMGCCLGRLYLLAKPPKLGELFAWVAELLVLALAIGAALLQSSNGWDQGMDHVRFVLLFTLPGGLLVWMIARYEGGLSRLLSHPLLVKLGDLSPDTFLIHAAVLAYGRAAMRILPLPSILFAGISLAVTLLAALLAGWLRNRAAGIRT